MSYTPSRGDVIWIDLHPQAGHEQAGRRPAIVVSPNEYNSKVGLCLLCPISNQIKGYPFEIPLPVGLSVTGVVLADQVKNLDWRARRAELITELPFNVTVRVLNKIHSLLEPEID